jgi:GT2 family glycosyltransferase
MGTPAPDAVKRLVDHFDQDRRVFLSGDYKEEQLRAEFLNGHCLTVRRSDFDAWTFLSPFFTALGWDMDHVLDTARNWGSVPLLPTLDIRQSPR